MQKSSPVAGSQQISLCLSVCLSLSLSVLSVSQTARHTTYAAQSCLVELNSDHGPYPYCSNSREQQRDRALPDERSCLDISTLPNWPRSALTWPQLVVSSSPSPQAPTNSVSGFCRLVRLSEVKWVCPFSSTTRPAVSSDSSLGLSSLPSSDDEVQQRTAIDM